MPRIVMGNGKGQTVDKFQSTPLQKGEERYVLIDSDAPVGDNEKESICQHYNEKKPNLKQPCTTSNTYLMIQEAEAWILSQQEVLKKYKIKLNKLPQKNVMEIPNPSDLMASMYKDSGKEYHKVRDFSRVFPELDTKALKEYFSEFKSLIEVLGK